MPHAWMNANDADEIKAQLLLRCSAKFVGKTTHVYTELESKSGAGGRRRANMGKGFGTYSKIKPQRGNFDSNRKLTYAINTNKIYILSKFKPNTS